MPREPFVQFPLWAMKKAFADHVARCPACAGVQPGDCIDSWYANMLKDKIEVASRG